MCDGQPNCSDRSDEIDCNLMRIDPTYLNTVPPKNITKLDAPLIIETEVIVESVLDINEVGSTIQLQLTVELSWFDSRVEFIDVNPDGNPLTMEHKSTLWMPTLTFPNTKEKLSVSFGSENSSGIVAVVEGVTGERNSLNDLRSEQVYQGKNW